LGAVLVIELLGRGGDVVAFLLFTPLVLIFGEIVPKSVYQQRADTLAPIIIYPLRFFSYLFFPITFLFSKVAVIFARLTGHMPGTQHLFTEREQMRLVLDTAEQVSGADVFDRQRIRQAIRFADITVGEVMVALNQIPILDSDYSLERAVRLARSQGYSRLPVYDKEQRRITGIAMFNTWNLLLPNWNERSLSDLTQPAHYVASAQPIDQLLATLNAREDHMAIVVDELGTPIGLITVEDILEEVVGEVEDVDFRFHSRSLRNYTRINKDLFLMDGGVPIADVNEVLGLSLPSKEFHTLAGLMIARLSHIPAVGESILESGYQFTVEESDGITARKIRVERC
jgi:CBS domain containing-hemolysin-like protein